MLNVTLSNFVLLCSFKRIPLISVPASNNLQFTSIFNSKFSKISSNFIFSSEINSKKLVKIAHSKFSDFIDTPIYFSSSNSFFKQNFYKSINEKNCNLKIENCYFDKCRALSRSCGGAIFAENTTIFISQSIFDKSKTFESGGAIYLDKCPECNITLSLYQLNSATHTSASIHSHLTFLFNLSYSNFTLERSELRVSSIALISTDTAFITSSIFHNNTCESKGAIWATSGVAKLNMVTFAYSNSDTNLYSNYLSKINIDNSIIDSAIESAITWDSNLRCVVTGTSFNLSQNEAFRGINQKNIIIGPRCSFNHNVSLLLLPTMYGTYDLPDPTDAPLPTVPQRTKVIIGNQGSQKNQDKKDKLKIDIILDNGPDSDDKQEKNEKKDEQIIVVQKHKIPERTPSPTINRAKPPPKRKSQFDTQQIALVGALILIIVIGFGYRYYNRSNIPDPTGNLFEKLEKQRGQLPRGPRFDANDDFFD